jgi:hypothetical protein
MTTGYGGTDEQGSSLDALLDGGPVPPGLEPVAAVLSDLAGWAHGPTPVPSATLARQLAGGAPGGAVPAAVDLTARRKRHGARAVSTALAVALVVGGSVGAAAAEGKLPDRAQNAVAAAVAALTPFSVPHAQHHPRIGLTPPVPSAVFPNPPDAQTPAPAARHLVGTGTPLVTRQIDGEHRDWPVKSGEQSRPDGQSASSGTATEAPDGHDASPAPAGPAPADGTSAEPDGSSGSAGISAGTGSGEGGSGAASTRSAAPSPGPLPGGDAEIVGTADGSAGS